MKKTSFVCIMILSIFLLLGCNNEKKDDNNLEIKEPNISIEDNVIDSENLEVKEDNTINFEIETIIYQEESKIDVILKAINENSDILWDKKWEKIDLTELLPNSEYVVSNDRIYIEVGGKLYVMNIITGEEIFKPIIVGVTEIPVLDNEGNVYCTGYYGPLFTKISPFGEIKWQIEDIEDIMWPGKPYIEGEYIYVSYQAMDEESFNTCQFRIDNGLVGNSYWIEEKQLLWEKVEASSFLDDHDVSNLLDNNQNTAWVEGKSDSGIGEWIYFESPIEKTISKMSISNGYHKTNELYLENNRIDIIEIETSDGNSFEVGIVDYMLPIGIEFEEPLKTNSIRLKIKSVYSGSKYNDTVISGIKFY